MSPDATPPRSAEAIAAVLAGTGRGARRQLVGAELEMALVRVEDLRPPSYDGPGGVGAFLERILREEPSFEPSHEAGRLIALSRADGEGISLEPGGQVEVSTAPQPNLTELDRALRETTRRLAALAEAEGLLLIAGSLYPAPQEAMPWMPKSRYACMRDYFASLGEAGRLAHVMMQRTLSTQVSVDFVDAADAVELLRLGFLVAPAATAAFANSPFDGREESGFRSFRAEAWRFTDPSRCGDVPACARPDSTLRDYVEYVLDAPMMFRLAEGKHHVPMHGASFRQALEAGTFPDGSPVLEHDLWDHFSSVFPHARLKKGLVELRSTDGQFPGESPTIAAFWGGLLYDPTSRAAVAELLAGADDAERARADAEAPRLALEGTYAGRPMRDVARDLVAIARAGLERQVAVGEEVAPSVALLDPLQERVEAGRTPADELLDAWRGAWNRDPRKLVEHLAFRQ